MGLINHKQTHTPSWQWVLLIIVFLAASRLIPHPPNFTPIGAMALLAGANLKDLRVAFVIPLASMLLSDSLLGFHSTMAYIYIAMVIIILASYWWLKSCTMLTMAIGAVASSIVFFIISNFGAWLSHDMYPQNLSGLLQAYTAGIPFFRNTLVSNLVFTAVGFYALKQLPKARTASN